MHPVSKAIVATLNAISRAAVAAKVTRCRAMMTSPGVGTRPPEQGTDPDDSSFFSARGRGSSCAASRRDDGLRHARATLSRPVDTVASRGGLVVGRRSLPAKDDVRAEIHDASEESPARLLVGLGCSG